MSNYVYSICSYDNTRRTCLEANSMIDAARKFMKRDVRRMKKSDFGGQIKWCCHVLRFNKADLRIPEVEGYFY